MCSPRRLLLTRLIGGGRITMLFHKDIYRHRLRAVYGQRVLENKKNVRVGRDIRLSALSVLRRAIWGLGSVFLTICFQDGCLDESPKMQHVIGGAVEGLADVVLSAEAFSEGTCLADGRQSLLAFIEVLFIQISRPFFTHSVIVRVPDGKSPSPPGSLVEAVTSRTTGLIKEIIFFHYV